MSEMKLYKLIMFFFQFLFDVNKNNEISFSNRIHEQSVKVFTVHRMLLGTDQKCIIHTLFAFVRFV